MSKLKENESKNKTYETLRRISRKQIMYIIIALIIVFAILALSGAVSLSLINKDVADLEVEVARVKLLNDTSEPIYWENRDSKRISRDYAELDKLYKRLFTFRTLEDMLNARELAKEIGLSASTLNLLYDPNDIISNDMLTGGESASYIDCYYVDSDIFLIAIYDDFYRYLSRVSLDVLADYNVALILFLDVDESGEIINDLCYISSEPSENLFK